MAGTHAQLAFPWAPPERTVLDRGLLRGGLEHQDVSFELVGGATYQRLTLSSRREPPGIEEETLVVELDVGAEPVSTVHERTVCVDQLDHLPWQMSECAESELGPLSQMALWALRRLVGWGHEHEIWRNLEAFRRLERLAEVMSRRALAACEPTARRLALQFHPSARFFAYALMQRHGARLRQAAEVCPGVLALAAAGHRLGAAEEVAEVIEALARGVRLHRVIDLALRMCGERPQRGQYARIDPRLQRIIVRRAPASIEPLALFRPAPAGIDLADIPAATEARAGWYRVISALAHTPSARRLRPEARRVVVGFVSRHAAAILASARTHQRSFEEVIDEVVDYAARSGDQLPSRRASPERVLMEVTRWHLESWTSQAFADDTRLLTCWLGEPAPPLRVTQIETVGALRQEGRVQRHCVASYAKDAVIGEVYLYKVEYEGERLTLAVSHAPHDGFEVSALAGAANRRPSVEARRAVEAWVREAAALRPEARDAGLL